MLTEPVYSKSSDMECTSVGIMPPRRKLASGVLVGWAPAFHVSLVVIVSVLFYEISVHAFIIRRNFLLRIESHWKES